MISQEHIEQAFKVATLMRGLKLNDDIQSCNCYDFTWQLEPETGCLLMDLPEVEVYIELRNSYCDRGRYGFWVQPKVNSIVSIDGADGFPRYFFKLQRALDELKDWIDFNKNRIHGHQDNSSSCSPGH